jgi:hypothetical protein
MPTATLRPILALDAQRLERNRFLGPADARIGAEADADRRPRGRADIDAGESAAIDLARRKDEPRDVTLLGHADIEADLVDLARLGLLTPAPAGAKLHTLFLLDPRIIPMPPSTVHFSTPTFTPSFASAEPAVANATPPAITKAAIRCLS